MATFEKIAPDPELVSKYADLANEPLTPMPPERYMINGEVPAVKINGMIMPYGVRLMLEDRSGGYKGIFTLLKVDDNGIASLKKGENNPQTFQTSIRGRFFLMHRIGVDDSSLPH